MNVSHRAVCAATVAIACCILPSNFSASSAQAQQPRSRNAAMVVQDRAAAASSVGLYNSLAVAESGEAVATFNLRADKTVILTRIERKTGRPATYEGIWNASGGRVYVSLTLREGQLYRERIAFARRGETLTAVDYDSTLFATNTPLVVSRDVGNSREIGFVSGIVTYRQRMALPPGAVITVELADVSRVDAPVLLLSRRVMREVLSPPIPFRLGYRKSAIDSRHTYVVQAKIVDGSGQLLFRNTRRFPILTNGTGRVVEVQVDMIQGGGNVAPRPIRSTTPRRASRPTTVPEIEPPRVPTPFFSKNNKK